MKLLIKAIRSSRFNKPDMTDVLSVKDVAKMLNKSNRWVYDYGYELGGSKVGGCWFFTQKGVQNAIQARQKMERSRQNKRPQAGTKVVQYQARGSRMGKRNKKAIETERKTAARRHGLDDFL